jgi:hypothetical protein
MHPPPLKGRILKVPPNPTFLSAARAGVDFIAHGGDLAMTALRRVKDWNKPVLNVTIPADVVELILRRRLPRALSVASVVSRLYSELWDGPPQETQSGRR